MFISYNRILAKLWVLFSCQSSRNFFILSLLIFLLSSGVIGLDLLLNSLSWNFLKLSELLNSFRLSYCHVICTVITTSYATMLTCSIHFVNAFNSVVYLKISLVSWLYSEYYKLHRIFLRLYFLLAYLTTFLVSTFECIWCLLVNNFNYCNVRDGFS